MTKAKYLPLTEVTTLVTDGKHGDCENEENSGFYFLSSKDLRDGRLHYDKPRQINYTQFAETHRRTNLEFGDILLANTGASIGRVGIAQVDERIPNTTFQKSISVIKADRNVIDNRYLYYFFRNNSSLLSRLGGGAAQPNLLLGDIRKIQVRVPERAIQLKISKVLTDYDELIENNSRRINILEEMAQSLYLAWFVNFCYPNHEDSSDTDGTHQLIDSSIGQIPDGWEVKSAQDAITINPKTKLDKSTENPFVGMSGLAENSMVIDDVIQKKGNSGTKFVNGDTLFARITPCLQNGKTGYVQFLTEEQPVGFGSTEFIVLRESDDLSSEFIYLLSRSNNFREHAIRSMTGATGRQRVHKDCFASLYIAVPPRELVDKFTTLVSPMFKSIFNLSKRNENLKKQRDMLLPKLISGGIEL